MSESVLHLPRLNRWLRRVFVGVLLKLTDIGLTALGYRRMCRFLMFLSPQPDPTYIQFPLALSTARHINQATILHLNSSKLCLRRSVLLWWLLRWRRIPSTIRIGVNPDGGHAWVEHHGLVINDRADVADAYSVVYSDQLSPEGVVSRL